MSLYVNVNFKLQRKFTSTYKWLSNKLRPKYIILLIIIVLSLFNFYLMYMNKSISWFPMQMSKIDYETFSNALFDIQGNFVFSNTSQADISMLPHERGALNNDRIINQMRYIPRNYNENSTNKVIFVDDSIPFDINITMCPVQRCTFTFSPDQINISDAVLLRSFVDNYRSYGAQQIVIVYVLESPLYFELPTYGNVLTVMNWTATYRTDASIVTPYYKITAYDNTKPWPTQYPLPNFDYTLHKTIPVAWFVSNCNANNKRLELAKALRKYLQVDIYGVCGYKICARSTDDSCFRMLSKYWFYLSFENSNCRHYITEKFFLNALNSSVVPIVMGAHPDDYKLVAPPHSYIHVEDFTSMQSLINYLKYLMKNQTAYNEYFAWKSHMNIDTNTFFWCRLCTMVHYADGKKLPDIPHMRKWWNTDSSCTASTWVVKQYW